MVRRDLIVGTGNLAEGAPIIAFEPPTPLGVRTLVLDALRELELDVAVGFREEHVLHDD